MMDWNKQQLSAIEKRGCSILVSAGAGSGKTAVLTERIVKLIEEGNSILDFVICTFTDDATIEMKNRIRERLIEKRLTQQADLVYMSAISTIHSLCKKIVEENFDVVGLPAKFTILSNEAVLVNQAIDNTLNTLFEEEDFVNFAMKIAPANDGRIRQLLLSAFYFCCDIPDYEAFIKEQADKYLHHDYRDIISNYCRLKGYEIKEILGSYNRLLTDVPLEDKEQKLVEADVVVMDGLLQNLEANILASCSFERMPSKMPNKDEINAVRKTAKTAAKEIEEYKAKLECDVIMDDAGENLLQLLKGVSTFANEYSRIKLEKGYLTFNDLEQYAYKILADENTAKGYRDRYRFIFVDEYQDTSKLQQAILDRLKAPTNMFMVGDVKQSIYGFRNADPNMFHSIYKAYGYEGEQVKIDLPVNYRSTENILNCVNDIFSVLLNLTEEFYPKEAYLYTDTKPGGLPVDVDIFSKDKDEAAQAAHVVSRIQQSVKEGYSYKDICVLLYSVRTELASQVYSRLQEAGIPVSMSSGQDELFMESRIFIDLLFLIDNPDNDIPLISVLFSEIGKMSVDDLIKIKAGKKRSFYECVCSYRGEKELEDKISSFLSLLDHFNRESKRVSVDELMSMVLMGTGYLKTISAHENSSAKISEIYNVIKAAKDYEDMGYFGLSGFLSYYSAMDEVGKSPEVSGYVEGSDAVNIMTIHKSKGLAFPVVILGDMGKKMYRFTDTGYWVFNNDMGIALCHIDEKRKMKIQTPMMELIKKQNQINTLNEKMRMLYVAMTRAKDKLIIMGKINMDELESIKEQGTTFAGELMAGTTSYLQCILSAIYTGDNKGVFNINEISVSAAPPVKKKTVQPEYNERVFNLLEQQNDTSTIVIPKKASVSSLTKKKDVFVPYKSRGKAKENMGALAGTVTHGLLSIIRQGERVCDAIERMREGEYFKEDELELVNTDAVNSFVNSDVYKRMCNSKKVFREKPFILEMDESTGYTDCPVMVQGIIDCMFKEKGGYVLVDYKTDNVVKNAEDILKEKYSKQLELYAFAIEELTGKPVLEKIIFHLKTGKTILV